ncbi:hypothetical protein ACET3Z_019036 [Daucus carota]
MFSFSPAMGSILDLEQALTAHLVAIPFPARGHINPMINFCKLLATKQPDILITFIVTEEWLGFLSSGTKPPDNMQFQTIPNVIPSELVRATDYSGFLKATFTEMKTAVEQVIEGLQPKPVVILYDAILNWALSIQGNIPTAAFWAMSATVFSMYLHYNLLCQNGHLPVLNLSEQGDNLIDYIPGVPSTRILDLPTSFYVKDHEEVLYKCVEAATCAQKSNYLVFALISELEQQVIDSLRSKLSVPIYTIGPAIPYFQIKHNFHNDQGAPGYIKWLDNQAEKSVLYISQGSFLSVYDDQLKEIIAGIHEAGVHYLWVTRVEASKINSGNSDRGMVVPWCDQLRVLCHPSVGGFWTHGGWNSTKEGVFAGVPMITSPLRWDQVPNSKMIVDGWGIGWRVKNDTGLETVITSNEIAEVLKRFMDLESAEGKELRTRVKALKEISQEAVAEGGSADSAIYAFLRDITKSQSH